MTAPHTTLTPAQIAQYAAAAGFRDGAGYQGKALTWAVAVALAESGGNPVAVNVNSNGSRDRGLWQINNKYHPEVSDAAAFDPASAAKAAYTISKAGTSWSPWAAFNNGAAGNQLGRASLATGGLSGGAIGAPVSAPSSSDALNSLPGWLKGAVSLIIPGGLHSITDIGAMAHAVGLAVTTLLKMGAWIADPHNWLRVMEVNAGAIALLVGIYLLARTGAMGTPVVKAAKGATKVAKNTAMVVAK
jgi:hypothetical protein